MNKKRCDTCECYECNCDECDCDCHHNDRVSADLYDQQSDSE